MNNNYIWACINLKEDKYSPRVCRPLCSITNKPCVCSHEIDLLYGFGIVEFDNCPAFSKNPKYYIDDKKKQEKGLENFRP